MTKEQTTKLEIRGITKSYGRTLALGSTDLVVEKGEFLTLLGPSGSGKTTLLMMIAGLTEPSGGRILIDGVDVTDRPSSERNIGVVFQNYALFPHMTVAENVAFPLKMRRRPADETAAAVKDALAIAQLDELAGRYTDELSGGQQQRVALARAIVFRPALVLMDEPLGALDKRLRDDLKEEIRRMHRQLGTTIVYVTHDQDEAMMLSDRICLMDKAQVVQVDPPSRLYNAPKSRFAADFLGESNLLPAQVVSTSAAGLVLRLTGEGVAINAAPAPGLSEGDEVLAMIRPERLRLAGAGEAGTIPAEVTAMLDLGGVHRLRASLAGGTKLRVTLLGQRQAVAEAGSRIALAVDASDVVVLGPEAVAS